MRTKKFYTVKEWDCFRHNNYFDMQDMLCQKYNVILTDHKTKKEKIILFLKKFNQRDFDKAINQFSNFVKEFGKLMDQVTREIDFQYQKDTDVNKTIWGKSTNSVPIWRDSEEDFSSQTNHEANLEKIWGKRK